MITAIISQGQVNGAAIWLIGWIMFMCLYFAVTLLIKNNRNKKQSIKNVFSYFLIAEFITDLIWALVYYDNSGYINYGIGAVYGLIIWPIFLIIAAVLVTIENKRGIIR